jgi:hypothetical protein
VAPRTAGRFVPARQVNDGNCVANVDCLSEGCIQTCLQKCRRHLNFRSTYPNGIVHQSPGLARAASLPWDIGFSHHLPQGGCGIVRIKGGNKQDQHYRCICQRVRRHDEGSRIPCRTAKDSRRVGWATLSKINLINFTRLSHRIGNLEPIDVKKRQATSHYYQ